MQREPDGHWSQRVGGEYFARNPVTVTVTDTIQILLHKLGHIFTLDDFHDWSPTGMTNFVMLTGSAGQITESNNWTLKDGWRNLKWRYSL